MLRKWPALTIVGPAIAAAGLIAAPMQSLAMERTVHIAGFGAKSGVVRSFGVNTEAVMRAAANHINEVGRG